MCVRLASLQLIEDVLALCEQSAINLGDWDRPSWVESVEPRWLLTFRERGRGIDSRGHFVRVGDFLDGGVCGAVFMGRVG